MRKLKAEKRDDKRARSTKHMSSLADQIKRKRPLLRKQKLNVKRAS